MSRTELLAPAGNLESLRAAIAAGADAVYLGASAFSARAQVGFDEKSLAEAISLAHLYGRRVYVAVNTLIKEQEWPQLVELLHRLGDLRPDAVLVQDLGALSQIKETLPQLQVHASTQMAVHNTHGAKFLLQAGISRVVAARECTLEDIRGMAASGIEVETFIHGALCVSVSGQCLLSSQIGGRSGNRGRCAQPCRLPYRYKEQEGALLSMRDLNTLEKLPELMEAGVCSFKIEGRLKRPEYITEVVSLYREALDLALRHETLDDSAKYQERLSQIFNRGGFTKGHLFGAQDAALIGPVRVSHEGIQIGRILKSKRLGSVLLAECQLTKALHDGDGLQVRGAKDQEIIYSGPAVPGGKTAVLRLREMPRAGDAVYRLADESQLSSARERAAIMPQIPFSAVLQLRTGEPAVLTLETNDGVSAVVTGVVPAPAKSQPLQESSAEAYLGKTGGTPFKLLSVQVISETPLFLPAASLNNLRREGLLALERAIVGAYKTPPAKPQSMKRAEFVLLAQHKPQLYAIVRNAVTYHAVKDSGLCRVIYSPHDYRPGKLDEVLGLLDPQDMVALPPQMRDENLHTAFRQITGAGNTLMLANVSQLALSHQRPFMVGDAIPVWNNRCAKVVSDFGAGSVCLSRELSEPDIAGLDKSLTEWILPVYGRAKVMLLNHCPERVKRGLSSGRAGCKFCDKGQGVREQMLEDRFKAAYPLLPLHFPHGCVIEMFHHTPLNLLDKAPRMSWLMDFTNEPPQEAMAIVRTYHALLGGGSAGQGQPNYGRFLEGVL